MNYDVLHNFISPVTGRILCPEDYILVGDRDGIAEPSTALIKLRHDVNELLNATFILEEANLKLPKAQALNILDDGFMYNTGGIISTTNDVPLLSLEYKHLWIGDSNNKPEAVTTIDIDNLPNLTNNMVWQGNAQGRPEEVELNFAAVDATYIIKQPNATLTNAQVLSELGTGMAKIVAGGAFGIAIPDEDYATKETLEQIKAETEEFKNQAATSASDAHDSAVSSAGSASQSLQYLNQLLNTGINLAGDVLGIGPLKDPITLTFKSNPTFTGTGSMTIPVGSTAQRPNNPVLGMIRINTDL